MDNRAPLGGARIQRPSVPPRAVSGGSYGNAGLPKRPTLPSRLSSVRSASQPVTVVDLTVDVGMVEAGRSNATAFMENKEKIVSSPDVISIDDDDFDVPPAKRAKTGDHDFRHEDGGLEDDTEIDSVDEVVPGSPLPVLPWSKPAAKWKVEQRRQRVDVHKASRRAYGLEPPAVATRVPAPKKVLDFSPWTGNHPEDVLTENVVKNGYSDTMKTGQSECNSAKAAIWPSLAQKNHQGLSMLGYLFTHVMEKRQVLGRCTAPSTFKPPPRVTVTDTKREAWLRDLANPEVPLRKQSRTIPHGIRGKLLMDQCLSKSIPLQRAVWLAKCVGANELRAFRRKGVSGSAAASGEIKWVREWTLQVEQFVESVIALCGQEDWQSKMNYAVKLATAFFAEKLLELDHYLDWIVNSLAEAALERLPVWLVLAQLYWKPITAYSKRGKAFAKGILEHLHRITTQGPETNAPLRDRLHKLVAVLAVSDRGCLIIPQTWKKYKSLLEIKHDWNDGVKYAVADIARRNERLAGSPGKHSVDGSSPLLGLYHKLDHLGSSIDLERMVASCLAAIPNHHELVVAWLRWASTPYRTGIARVYLVARMIAHLRATGLDTDTAILGFLRDADGSSPQAMENLYRVVMELTRIQAFSVGRYLQWLISGGAASSSVAVGVLAILPTADLPQHLNNTRKSLMARHGLNSNESMAVERALSSLDFETADDAGMASKRIELIENLTMSAQHDLSRELCRKAELMAKYGMLSLAAFNLARDVIEQVKDISSLAQLVSATATSTDTALLATICDTVNYCAESFAAMDVTKQLVDALAEQYISVRAHQQLDRIFILALTDLARRTAGNESLVKLLKDDLVICEQQNSVAVCSPASDSLVGMQATSLDTADDIDNVFASGNTMDEQLMQRVFARIMQHATKPQSANPASVSRVVGWLHQLELVDSSGALNNIVQAYLRNSLQSTTTDSSDLLRTVDALVASGIAQLADIANIAKDLATPQVSAHLLSSWLSEDVAESGLSQTEQYRLRLRRELCKADNPASFNTLSRVATEWSEFGAEDPSLLQFIIRQNTLRPGYGRSFFEGGTLSDTVKHNAGRVVVALLQADAQTSQRDGKIDVMVPVSLAEPLSVHFCVEVIKWLRGRSNWTSDDDVALEMGIRASFEQRSEVWPHLLGAAGERVNAAMHKRAQEELLNLAGKAEDAGSEVEMDRSQHWLNLLTVTGAVSDASDSIYFVRTVTGHLKDLEARLTDSKAFELHDTWANYTAQLDTLLRLCATVINEVADEPEASIQARTNLLSALCSLLVHPALQMHQDVTEYIFDLASTLSTSLPDLPQDADKPASFVKLLPDPRLAFILGPSAKVADTWLALITQQATPVTQQQRALSRHSTQHLTPQMSSRTSTPGQQSSQGHMQAQPQGQRINGPGRVMPEVKVVPFALRRWEIMPDPTPVMGENDASLSLALFGARKV